MRSDYTDISIVLDRSGSMETVRKDTIGGFNSFLKDQKALPGLATLTLVQFDDHYEIVHKGKSISEVPELNDYTFIPRGSTALLDAVGKTINSTGERLAGLAEEDRPGKVLFVIITDGEENASREFTGNKVPEMIAHQRETYDWQFLFLGANIDAVKIAKSYSISADSALKYAGNAAGTTRAFASASTVTTTYRTGAADAKFSMEDRDAQTDAGV